MADNRWEAKSNIRDWR